MYEILKQYIEKNLSVEEKINKTREYLQILALKIMFDREIFNNVAFVGGTALRILYDLKRYSEDLDFSLIEKKGYSFKKLIDNLLFEFNHYGFKTEVTRKETMVVHSSMVKFPGLLKELGLSNLKGHKLSIKLEIDTNPPEGWNTAVSPVSESFIFAVKHFDLPSLFATKLHACFFRKYTKGRDFYDLVWYLGKKILPNFKLLNNAIMQTEKKSMNISADNLKEFMAEKIEKTDFNAVRKDVERFLEDKNELKMLNKDIILQMI
ncbi:MAG: nucleotidyl transferase AbiEii/AbiGii toxin family protein [Elusimicrobia bacterium]|nr:nucleotidyl transferase AbiEii/AbiGii toxin family protein [Elusimicrobiota bacterium]